MKVVGVTGGHGFIGEYVCETLEKHGYKPLVLDHVLHEEANYAYMIGDIKDRVDTSEFVAHVDGVIHLAACLGTQETIDDPYPAAETNLLGGINLLQAAAKYKVPMAYIAVGNWWMNNPYSITKNMIERFCHMYNKDRGTKINIVRAVNAYGPRQLAAAPFGPGKVRKITPAFICRALSDMPIEVYGTGKQVSDMVYVGDVAEALVRALVAASEGVVFDKAVEIGPSDSKTVNEVAEFINRLCSNKHIVKHLPMRPGETKDAKVVADTSTLGLIGMDANSLVPLNIGMRETVKYFKESEGKAWFKPEPKTEPDQKTCTEKGCDEPGYPYCDKHNAP